MEFTAELEREVSNAEPSVSFKNEIVDDDVSSVEGEIVNRRNKKGKELLKKQRKKPSNWN